MRCLALAEELRGNQGCKVVFAMRSAEIGFQEVREHGYAVMTPGAAENFNYHQWMKGIIQETKADAVVLDVRDDLPSDVLKDLRSGRILIVTIDDPSDRRLDADLAFYPPVPQLREMNWDGFKGVLYAGWEWVILRKEFTKTSKRIKNKRPVILVTMGGSDPEGLTLKAVAALDMVQQNFDAIVILGKGFQHHEELHELLLKTKQCFRIQNDVQNMAEIMAGSDLAVISFGTTAYELSAMGVPAIYLCLTGDHSQSASIFVNKGIALNMGVHDSVSKMELANTISRYLSDEHRRIKMAEQFKKIPKMDGARRIAALISERI